MPARFWLYFTLIPSFAIAAGMLINSFAFTLAWIGLCTIIVGIVEAAVSLTRALLATPQPPANAPHWEATPHAAPSEVQRETGWES